MLHRCTKIHCGNLETLKPLFQAKLETIAMNCAIFKHVAVPLYYYVVHLRRSRKNFTSQNQTQIRTRRIAFGTEERGKRRETACAIGNKRKTKANHRIVDGTGLVASSIFS